MLLPPEQCRAKMIFEYNSLSFLLTLGIAVAFGIFYRPDSPQPGALLTSLQSIASLPLPSLTVALGSNVCVDLIVQAADVLDIGTDVPLKDLPALESLSDVNSVFMQHFAAGAAGERSCRDASAFGSLVAKADAQATARRSLGGNAALMARKLSKSGVKTVLGGHVGPTAASLLPANVAVVGAAAASSPGATHAVASASTDEVHLILEYGTGTTLGGVTATRANRFIVTADLANQDASALIETIKAADAAGVHALVVAGLHMLEPMSAADRQARLDEIASSLAARAGKYSVHLELASSGDAAWTRLLADSLFPLIDSIGFNEQEGAFLYEALGGTYGGGAAAAANATSCVGARGEVTGATNVKVASIACLMRHVLQTYPTSLSRIHFHSLALHAIAHRPLIGKVNLWREAVGAVAAGAVAATTEACQGDVAALAAADTSLLYSVSPTRVNVADPLITKPGEAIVQHLDPDHPVATWKWSTDIEFALAPVPACRKPRSTVGLGDAISAAGLAADVRV